MAQAQVVRVSQCTATLELADVAEVVRCWRPAGHPTPHIAPDGDRWTATESPAIAPQSHEPGPSGQRQPENLSDDYPPYSQQRRTLP